MYAIEALILLSLEINPQEDLKIISFNECRWKGPKNAY
jgi:hypothetical protein